MEGLKCLFLQGKLWKYLVVLVLVRGLECCNFGFDGEGCEYLCHCISNDRCDSVSGHCETGCYDGSPNTDFWVGNWTGPGCQIGNVAYKKIATQLGGWPDLIRNVANNAVDGHTNQNLEDGYCAHTSSNQGVPWWKVDLGKSHVIERIEIVNRDQSQDRLHNADLYISEQSDSDGSLCGNTASSEAVWMTSSGRIDAYPNAKDRVIISCPSPMIGTYVTLRGSEDSLNICEVYVWGYQYEDCADEVFGPGCLTPCNCDTACADIGGVCPGTCVAGKTGQTCQQDCTDGQWGKSCSNFCNCLTTSEICNKVTGQCQSGCRLNYGGTGCQIELLRLTSQPQAENIMPYSVDVRFSEWEESMGGEGPVDHYMVQYKPEDSSEWLDGVEAPHTGTGPAQVTQTNLSPSTTYQMRVVPVHSDGQTQGIASAIVLATTLQATTTEFTTVASTTVINISSPQKTNIGLIVGIVILLIAIIIAAVVILLIYLRRKRKNSGYKKANRPEIIIVNGAMGAQKGIVNESFESPAEPEIVAIPDPPQEPPPQVPVSTPVNIDMPEEHYVNQTRLIPVSELATQIEQLKNDLDAFKNEYKQIPSGAIAKWEVGNKPENKSKNRFLNIRAYDHSRVVLEKVGGDEHSDYINADYVPGYKDVDHAYIAAQGPKKLTVNDMWRMIWQTGSNRIVMVTNLNEGGKNKCDLYWPEKGSKSYGKMKVKFVSQEKFAEFTITVLSATLEEESRTIRHFHFTGWPDHGVPLVATSLLEFRRKVRQFDDCAKGPLVVHCSAGVGRTGTFMAIDYQLDQAKNEETIDVFSYTVTMRQQRINMIQTLDQYIFVYDALLEALRSGETAIPCQNFYQESQKLSEINPTSGKTKFEEQFEVLEILKPAKETDENISALYETNIAKNRFNDIFPRNRVRPYLSNLVKVDDTTDYINAAYIDGYKVRGAYIVTQMPLPSTVVDIWRLVLDHKTRTLIMLNVLDTQDEASGVYWPENEERTLIFGPILVELLSTEEHGEVTVREFKVCNTTSKKEPVIVRQFELKCWPQDAALPSSPDFLLEIQDRVERWQQQSGNGPITIHCLNGATRSGLFCAMLYLLEKMKVDQEIDVFQTVKHIRINRPQLIPSLEQYKFLHEVAQAYMDKHETYANFK